MSILSSKKNQYVKNDLKKQSRVESSIVAVAYQGINNARAVFSGSLDICKNLYVTDNSIGNSHFCIEFTKWTMGLETCILQVPEVCRSLGLKGLLKISELDDKRKFNYIYSLESSISQLIYLKQKIENLPWISSLCNVAGKVAGIAGTVLLFTPFFYAGLGALGVGSAALACSSLMEFIEITDNKNIKIDKILREEENARLEFKRWILGLLYGSKKGYMFKMKANDIKTMYDASSKYRTDYNGANDNLLSMSPDMKFKTMHDENSKYRTDYNGANYDLDSINLAMKLSMGLGSLSRLLYGANDGIWIADSIMTWKIDNSIIQKISNLIKEREEELKQLKED